MSCGSKFLPKTKTRTIESWFGDKAFEDQIIQWLYASGFVNDNEEVVRLDIKLPKDIPFSFTIKGGKPTN